ncbi:hypothetical protein H0H92_007395 [Tricholoma furcatifolium]|nr:hypothetical protein H0H92_007395 [Tricholoma furcatifolium]
MAEQTAGPSTIPVITLSTPNSEPPEDDSSSSSCDSPTVTALETPTSLEAPLSELLPLESTQSNEILSAPSEQQVPPKPGPTGVGINGVSLPRTQPGAPVTLKVSSKTTKTKDDAHQPWHGVVVDYAPQKEQVVVFPAKMSYSSPNIPYNNDGWAFQRTLGYSDHVASGFVYLNVNGEKRRKNVKDNTYVFIVLEGAVEVLIHQTSYAVSAGGVFAVPRGNYYSIRNISEKEAKVFFTQTRKVLEPTVEAICRPSSKSFMVADWLLQHILAYFFRFRARAYDWYWLTLTRYRHHFTPRRLYFLFFVLGLMIRRLPFIGSPPILNIQLIRLR